MFTVATVRTSISRTVYNIQPPRWTSWKKNFPEKYLASTKTQMVHVTENMKQPHRAPALLITYAWQNHAHTHTHTHVTLSPLTIDGTRLEPVPVSPPATFTASKHNCGTSIHTDSTRYWRTLTRHNTWFLEDRALPSTSISISFRRSVR